MPFSREGGVRCGHFRDRKSFLGKMSGPLGEPMGGVVVCDGAPPGDPGPLGASATSSVSPPWLVELLGKPSRRGSSSWRNALRAGEGTSEKSSPCHVLFLRCLKLKIVSMAKYYTLCCPFSITAEPCQSEDVLP